MPAARSARFRVPLVLLGALFMLLAVTVPALAKGRNVHATKIDGKGVAPNVWSRKVPVPWRSGDRPHARRTIAFDGVAAISTASPVVNRPALTTTGIVRA
jgi:hypothetical protein